MKEDGDVRQTQQGESIVRNAIAEFESTMGKSGTTDDNTKPRRGANPSRSKSVLGRGLSALMSVSSIQVPTEGGEPHGKQEGVLPPAAILPTADMHHSQPRPFPGIVAKETVEEGTASTEKPLEGGLAYLPIDRVFRNETQPRQIFSEEELQDLSKSIKESGLLQPIIVRRKSAEAGPLASYEIVAGERRWRAAQRASLTRIPALVRQLNDKETLELSIVENVQRANLNAVEEAQAYQRLIAEFGATQEQVAKTVGRDRTSVANALRLLKLEPEVLELLKNGAISAGHGRALLMVTEPSAQQLLAQKIVAEGLSVRAAERAAANPQELQERKGDVGVKASPPEASPAHRELEERFRRALGTKVKLYTSTSGKGELRIQFFSQAELESLLEKLNA